MDEQEQNMLDEFKMSMELACKMQDSIPDGYSPHIVGMAAQKISCHSAIQLDMGIENFLKACALSYISIQSEIERQKNEAQSGNS